MVNFVMQTFTSVYKWKVSEFSGFEEKLLGISVFLFKLNEIMIMCDGRNPFVQNVSMRLFKLKLAKSINSYVVVSADNRRV